MANSGEEKKPRNRKNIVQYRGVDEGKDFDYNADEIHFAFCDNLVILYKDEDGEQVKFEHFVQRSQEPKSGFALFDHQLVDNLTNMNVKSMRPSQIATMQATFFEPPAKEMMGPPDLLCISSTGSGKTIAYLYVMIQKCLDRIKTLPSGTLRTPMVLIFVSSGPLVDNIFQTAAKLTKGTDVKVERIAGRTQFIRCPFFDIGICTAGRFINHFYPDGNYVKLDVTDLKYLVIDEGDEMSTDHDFLKIVKDLKAKANFATFLFSATINCSAHSLTNEQNFYAFGGGKINQVAASIKTFFWPISLMSYSRISGAYNNGTINNNAYKEDELRHPFDALYHFVQQFLFDSTENKKKVIIFVKKMVVANLLALRLSLYGFPAVSVNGNNDPKINEEFLQKFVDGKCRILFATNMLTRGTDIDVEYVVNYDLPIEYDQWVHRCGRTGRNGKTGVAITFVDMNFYGSEYPRTTLQKIALNIDDGRPLPLFMQSFVEEVKRQQQYTASHLNDEDE
uniref:ATP-dependent RNA helicase n=1 Tax=Panagrolaimus sp. ES5 TaxID=591445 RepID=A0AC34FL68_9BILA